MHCNPCRDMKPTAGTALGAWDGHLPGAQRYAKSMNTTTALDTALRPADASGSVLSSQEPPDDENPLNKVPSALTMLYSWLVKSRRLSHHVAQDVCQEAALRLTFAWRKAWHLADWKMRGTDRITSKSEALKKWFNETTKNVAPLPKQDSEREDAGSNWKSAAKDSGTFVYEGPGQLLEWLRTTAERLVMEAWKRKDAAMVFLDLDQLQGKAVEYHAGDQELSLGGAWALLSSDDRDYLVLKYIEKRSFAEIARLKNITLKAVETRVYRAARRLREAVERIEGGPESLLNGKSLEQFWKQIQMLRDQERKKRRKPPQDEPGDDPTEQES